MRRRLAAGNWKMNGTAASLAEIEAAGRRTSRARVDVLLCPPATLVARWLAEAQHPLALGGQDCHAEASRRPHRRHLGRDAAGRRRRGHVIVGHSERRADHDETDEQVRAKAEAAAWRAGLVRHRLRRRDRGRARRRPDARRRRRAARRVGARRRDRREHGDRLRAGLGHRHRPHAHARRRSPRSTPSCAPGSPPGSGARWRRASGCSTAAR